jgi:hypothetical protein
MKIFAMHIMLSTKQLSGGEQKSSKSACGIDDGG